jgi:hypothetical protein
VEYDSFRGIVLSSIVVMILVNLLMILIMLTPLLVYLCLYPYEEERDCNIEEKCPVCILPD